MHLFLLFFPFFLYPIKIYILIQLSIMGFLPLIHHLPLIYYQFIYLLVLTPYLGLGFDVLQVSLESAS